MTTDRRCPICGSPMVRSPRESEREFSARRFCGKACGSRSRAAKYDALLRPRQRPDPQKPGPKPAVKPPCLACGKPTATPTAKYCSVLCANRHKPRSGAQIPQTPPDPPAPPKPRMATQRLCGPKPERPTGDGLVTIPKKKKAMPTVDAELCIFPAKPIWFADGRALVEELAQTLPLCSRIVSGWLATVPSDADEYVTPRFTTAETAALFDQMVDNKTGRRAA